MSVGDLVWYRPESGAYLGAYLLARIAEVDGARVRVAYKAEGSIRKRVTTWDRLEPCEARDDRS